MESAADRWRFAARVEWFRHGYARKAIAIVAAMPVELAPLLGKMQSQQVDGVDLFELPKAMVAIGGIGEKHARRAAEVVIEHAQPWLLVSRPGRCDLP